MSDKSNSVFCGLLLSAVTVVTSLALNDAITSTMEKVFPKSHRTQLIAKWFYAILMIALLIVYITSLSRFKIIAEKEATKSLK